MGAMDGHDGGSEVRGSVVQTVIALAIILVAFRVADVAPVRAEAPTAAPEAAYVSRIRVVDEAVLLRNAAGAARAWQEAYAAALATSGWEGLMAAGDAARRIGEIAGASASSEAKARTAYLAAFFRARQEGAVAGILKAADAFAALGDHEVAKRCRGEAADMVARGTARGDGAAVVSRTAR